MACKWYGQHIYHDFFKNWYEDNSDQQLRVWFLLVVYILHFTYWRAVIVFLTEKDHFSSEYMSIMSEYNNTRTLIPF